MKPLLLTLSIGLFSFTVKAQINSLPVNPSVQKLKEEVKSILNNAFEQDKNFKATLGIC